MENLGPNIDQNESWISVYSSHDSLLFTRGNYTNTHISTHTYTCTCIHV